MLKHTTQQTIQQTVRMGNWHHAIIIIIIIITNHVIQNPFSLKEEAPNLSQYTISTKQEKSLYN
jgi:hypothetical protein